MVQKKMNEIKCTDCGKMAVVPFKPTAGKPVYCRTCFSKHTDKRREDVDKDFSFNSKQAWARRGDNWPGRKAEKTAHVF